MPPGKGKFVWYELMTNDAKEAEAFYTKVVGWGAEKVSTPGVDYTLLTVKGGGVAGLMTMPEAACAAGAKPGWMGYIGVDDVDAYAKRVTEAGGQLHRPPMDIPGVGRFAIMSDPQGAIFTLFAGMGDPPPAPPLGTPGFTGWHELAAADWRSAFDFYSAFFGWTKDEAIDMGGFGIYQLFGADGVTIGGMMTKMAGMPEGSSWRYYTNVDAIDAAAERVKAAGGQVERGPMQVPGGNWIIHCLDPEGVFFALVSMRK